MSREKECYRDNLQRIDEKFPDKELLNMKEVAAYLGVSRRTMTRHSKEYGFNERGQVTKVKLARALS